MIFHSSSVHKIVLIKSEKLTATARMAATIAHEINNPLEAVTNLAFLLDSDSSLQDPAKGYAKLLLSELSRVGDITRKTLAFYRDETRPGEVNVSELVRGVVDLHEAQLRERNVHVIRHFDDSAIVWGFNLELRQAVFKSPIERCGSHTG